MRVIDYFLLAGAIYDIKGGVLDMLLCLNDHPYQCFRVTVEGKQIVDGKNIPRLFDVNTENKMRKLDGYNLQQGNKIHSLIISREVLILTLPILPALQGCIS